MVVTTRRPRVRRRRVRKDGRVGRSRKMFNKVKANQEMVTFMSTKQMPFPPRYRCKFTLAGYGYITAASGGTGQMSFLLNSVHLPFATGITVPNFLPAVATLYPNGVPALLNANLYNNCRVYGSKVQLEVSPEDATDVMEFTITPSAVTNVPATAQAAIEEAYTKEKIFEKDKTIGKADYLVNYITQHKFLGVDKKAIEYDLSGDYTHAYNGDPVNKLYWVINWANLSQNLNNTQKVAYTIKVTYYCELFGAAGANFVN